MELAAVESLSGEVVWAKPFNHKAKGTEQLWGTPHYIAMVLLPDQRMVVKDLGEADSVNGPVQALLSALRSPLTDPKKPARYVIFKAKPTFIFFHLVFQRTVEYPPKDPVPGFEHFHPEP